MKKLIALALAVLMLAALCAIPAAATEYTEINGYYESTAPKIDEILNEEAGETTTKWNVPYLSVTPVLDGTIGQTEYERFENYQDYITLACSTQVGLEAFEALYDKIKDGFFEAFWGWDGQYLYMAFEVDCVDGYVCTPNESVMLFGYNCLQIGLDDVDTVGRDNTYCEMGFGYDNVKGEDVTHTWNGLYKSGADDFCGRYDEASKRVYYELRIDLQQALGLDEYPVNGDQCNFAFVLSISGENNTSVTKQVMFCQGIGGRFGGPKAPQCFARITFTGKPDDVVIKPGVLPSISEEDLEYDLREVMDFSDAAIFGSMTGEGATIEQVTENEETFMRITAVEDGCYVYSSAYPSNVLCNATSVVIKYRATTKNAEPIGIIWKTRQDPEYHLDEPYDEYLPITEGWNYYVIDMTGVGTWQDYIRSFGLVPFMDEEGVAGSTLDIAWIKFYGEDAYDLYEDVMVTEPKETEEDDTNEDPSDDANVTTAPEGGEEQTTEAPKKNGCGSVVALPVVALVAALGVAFVAKKKD